MNRVLGPTRRKLLAVPIMVVLVTAVWTWSRARSEQRTDPGAESLARALLESLDAPAGFCVHLGVSDGELTTALSQNGKYLVHGLASDDASVEAARRRIERADLAGVVSVQKASWNRLPYADHLANLVVAEDLPGLIERGLPPAEVRRVLRPGGVAWLGGAAPVGTGAKLNHDSFAALLRSAGIEAFEIVERDRLWAKAVMPRGKGTDQWTHKGYDASGVRVSNDVAVDVPTGVRWMAGPQWPTGNRKSAVPGVVATEDQLVYLFQDEVETSDGVRPQDSLIARDAHNGLLLWKRAATKRSAALAAVGNRVYAVLEDGGPLVALDARCGKVLTTYEGTRTPRQVLHVDGRLLVDSTEGLACYDAASARLLWSHPSAPAQFVAAEGRVFLHATDRDADGARTSRFVCLDLNDGRPQWQQPTGKWSSGTPTLVLVYEGVLVAADTSGNHGVSARDGSHLWQYEYPTIGHGGSYLKVLGANGLIWVHTASAEGTRRYAWEGLDPAAGQVRKRLVQPADFSLKHRCSYDVATTRWIMCGSMDFAEYETGAYRHFSAARNSCAMACVLPANGILYTFPHACGCYPMLRGFLALESRPPEAVPWWPGPWRLVQGPAYGQPPPSVSAGSDDWPTYRRDPLRTAGTASAGPNRLTLLWAAQVDSDPAETLAAEWDLKDGGRLSSPVVAGSLALVAATDRHQLRAFDARTGRPRWTFTAGGRIDCPPTLHDGLCLFGARDGWVYAVRADDGALVWRFCAAPRDERIIAHGQLESKWPVIGGVLVYDGWAYFGVGRHAGADGGITVSAVEPGTGKFLWTQHAQGYQGIPDVLTAVDGAIQMASYRFDAKTGEAHDARETLLRGGRLGLLNDAWYRRPIAMRKNLQLWQATGRASAQMLAYHPQATCGFLASESVAGSDGKLSGDARLFVEVAKGGKGWTLRMPNTARLRAMALAPETAYVAGLLPAGGGKQLEYVAQAYALADGKLLAETKIGGAPVHDGLGLAGGRVYVSMQDGRLLCLGDK
jgi:outer membrane protein assembly factor BamB